MSVFRSTARQPANRQNARTVVLFSQVFTPDPASVGQHMSDVAAELDNRGRRVIVLTADRGYDDPTDRYPRRERIGNIEIIRLPFSSLGKRSFVHRMAGALIFSLQCLLITLFVRRLDYVVVSTAPPLCGAAALFVKLIRRVPYSYWVMDLNPDQLIALGSIEQESIAARFLEWVNALILRNAASVIALDEYMAERLRQKASLRGRLAVIPPWPHEKHLGDLPHDENPFRTANALDGRFVFMYSGNHSSSNPLTTFLDAAVRLQSHPDIVFAFVGGGLGKQEVDNYIRQYDLKNVRSLPYQSLDDLKYSLSAADVHLVSQGDAFVGIIHPCKVYGALATGRPVLFLGPERSHISEILSQHRVGWQIRHGDVDAAMAMILEIRSMGPAELGEMGLEARRVLARRFSQAVLCDEFIHAIEGTRRPESRPSALVLRGMPDPCFIETADASDMSVLV